MFLKSSRSSYPFQGRTLRSAAELDAPRLAAYAANEVHPHSIQAEPTPKVPYGYPQHGKRTSRSASLGATVLEAMITTSFV